MSKPISVLLVREQAEQVTGSGCCGKMSGDALEMCSTDPFEETRKIAEDFGVLHRTIKEFFPEEKVNVTLVDPRNQLYLFPKLVTDACTYRPGLVPSLQLGLQLFSLPAVIINGSVISKRNQPISPDDVCYEISQRLEEN